MDANTIADGIMIAAFRLAILYGLYCFARAGFSIMGDVWEGWKRRRAAKRAKAKPFDLARFMGMGK